VARAAASDLPLDVLHQEHLEAEWVIGSLMRRGQKESAFRDDLPAAWLASACLALIHSAAARVNAGQMSATSALNALLVTVVDLCVGPPSRRNRQR
jgi:TetR/AcrR family transcriptional regulator, mexCD-oprJ operon repressor